MFSHGLSREARVKGVMLRWWQPRHAGAGHDQWALDHVEVVLWVPNCPPAAGPPDWPPTVSRSAPVSTSASHLLHMNTKMQSKHKHTYLYICAAYHLQPPGSCSKCSAWCPVSGEQIRNSAVCFAVKGSCLWMAVLCKTDHSCSRIMILSVSCRTQT